MRYLVLTPNNLDLWYLRASHFELLGYSDADYVGCKVDRKSTYRTCQFLGRSLVSWSSKKQNYAPYPRPKRSMLPQVVVVHNFYGCNKLSRTMVTL
jgi:hypothetical protein